jgi:hypothetical protein
MRARLHFRHLAPAEFLMWRCYACKFRKHNLTQIHLVGARILYAVLP